MPQKLELPGLGLVTYDKAVTCEENILNKLDYQSQTDSLYEYLWQERETIEALASHHLGLTGQDAYVLDRCKWMNGSFNICIPIGVRGTSTKILMRCPMPHRLAESSSPGTVDEKISCEVGTYVWVQDNCPHIRIPHLYGFSFSHDRHVSMPNLSYTRTDVKKFTHTMHRSLYIRVANLAKRCIYALLRRPIPSKYTYHPTPRGLHTGYLLLEYIEPSTGQMLSNTWAKSRQDPCLKQNLFRGIARLLVSLAGVPQPRIGSFRFHDNGSVTLTNRPIPCANIILENAGTPRIIQRNDTYTCTDTFVSDMLTVHDNHFLNEPNAIQDEADCRAQMASMILLRAVSHHFTNREYRNGPFALQFTDFHASNLFVDAEWNITCLVDLEWICSLPVEMLAVPYWLTGHDLGEIFGNMDEFNAMCQEFMAIFKEEETAINKEKDISLTRIMHDTYESRGFWFFHCLTSVNAMNGLVEEHICPKFQFDLDPETEKTISGLWHEDIRNTIARKLADKEKYDKELRNLFEGDFRLRSD